MKIAKQKLIDMGLPWSECVVERKLVRTSSFSFLEEFIFEMDDKFWLYAVERPATEPPEFEPWENKPEEVDIYEIRKKKEDMVLCVDNGWWR